MRRNVIVGFRFFRSFVIAAFLFNSVAFFASFVLNAFVSFAAALLTLAWLGWCIRCSNCGRSPFVKRRGALRIGIPIPERTCSKCGRDFLGPNPK